MAPESHQLRHYSHHDHDGPEHHHEHDHGHHGGLWARIRHAITPHSHDAANSIDDALESSQRGIRAVKISLVALLVTAALQLGIVALSGSVALLADTIHNFSDALTAIPLWIAFVLSRRSATRRFTHGYGRAEDLAGLFVIAMILLSAVLAGWQAISRLIDPHPMQHLGWVAAAGVVGFLGNEAVALFRIREGNAIGSAALVADGHHARADGLTSLAVVLSAAGVSLGWHWADPVVGLAITVAILLILRTAARDVLTRLMDGVDPEMVDQASAVLAGQPGVVDVTELRMRWVGHTLHAEASIVVDDELNRWQLEAVLADAQERLQAGVPRLTAALIQPRPATSPAGARPAEA